MLRNNEVELSVRNLNRSSAEACLVDRGESEKLYFSLGSPALSKDKANCAHGLGRLLVFQVSVDWSLGARQNLPLDGKFRQEVKTYERFPFQT